MGRHSPLDILLVISPPWGVGNPHVGIAYLSSFLRHRGHRVHTYDMNIDLFHRAGPELSPLWFMEHYKLWGEAEPPERMAELLGDHLDRAMDAITKHEAPVVGLSCTCSNLEFILDVAGEVRRCRPDVKTVLGGPGTNSEPHRERIRCSGVVDAFVVGEGEKALDVYVRHVLAGHPCCDEPGLHTRENGSWTGNPPSMDTPLDDYPSPDFLGFNLDAYEERALPIVFSRGCWGRCSYCEISLLWQAHRSRSSASIVTEFEYHHREQGVDLFRNFDSAINQSPAVLRGVVEGLIERSLDIRWDGSFIADPRCERPFFRRLADAGCHTLYFGLESGSQRVLRMMRKPFNVATASRNIRDAAAAGIEVYLNLIVGFPGETEDDFQSTLDFVSDHRREIHRVGAVTTLQLMEGSQLHAQADDLGLELPTEQFNIQWRTRDGSNTPEIRKRRQNRLLRLLEELELEAPCCASLVDSEDSLASIQLPRPAVAERPLDLLLIGLPPWDTQAPPLGLACLQAYLKHAGYEVRVADLNVFLFNNCGRSTRREWRFDNSRIWTDTEYVSRFSREMEGQITSYLDSHLSTGCRYVGISLTEVNLLLAHEVAELVRRLCPDATLVAGGPDCFSREDARRLSYRMPGLFDLYVVGEGERTVEALLGARETGLTMRAVEGVFVPDRAEDFAPRAPMTALDGLPFPRYEDVDPDQYGARTACLSWSRGCKGRCSFCNVRLMWPRVLTRHPASILEEIRYHVERRHVRDFSIFDSAINVSRAHLEAVIDALESYAEPITWRALVIPSRGLESSHFDRLRGTGCCELDFGIESGSWSILQAMRRGSTPDQAARNLHDAHRAGIRTGIFLIVGYPGESEDDFLQTCSFIEQNGAAIDRVSQINTLCVLPRSSLERQLEQSKDGYTPGVEDWVLDDNDLDLRKQRVELLASVARRSGIHVEKSNV